MYAVYFLVGRPNILNPFHCRAMFGKFTKDIAEKHVADLRRMGYPAMATKFPIGGFESYFDFPSSEAATEYYNSVVDCFS